MMDERIYQGQRKIWSEMGKAMYYLAVGALLVKCLVLHMGLEDCVTEYLMIVGVPVYHMIRSWQLKLSFVPTGGERTKRAWLIRFGVLVVVGIFWALNGNKDWKAVAAYLVFFLAVCQIARMLVIYAERKRAKRLEEEFDD